MPYNTLMNTNPPMKPIKKEHWEDLYARLHDAYVNTNPPMKPIKKEHWEDLYARLHDAYVECITHNNPTYEQKLAQVLDHMRVNKQHLYIK